MSQSESIQVAQKVIDEATQVIQQPLEVRQEQLHDLAKNIPVSDVEMSEIRQDVAQRLEALRQVDIYAENVDVRQSFKSIFDNGGKRREQARDLMGTFAQENFRGSQDSDSFTAVNELRDSLEKYDPKKFGILAPERILGFIPMPGLAKKRLKKYARSFQSAETHINQIMDGVDETKEDHIRNRSGLDTLEGKLMKLAKELRKDYVMQQLIDEALKEYVGELEERDPLKAKRITSDLLYIVKKEQLQTVTSLNTTMLGAHEVALLKETQEMVIDACETLSNNGRLVLSVSQAVAFNADKQKQATELVQAGHQSLNKLMINTASGIKQHVKDLRELSENPITAVATLDTAFKDVFSAIDSLKDHERQRHTKIQGAIDAMDKRLKTTDERAQAEREALSSFQDVVASASQKVDQAYAQDGPKPQPSTSNPKARA